MDIMLEGEIASRFREGQERIRPIIYSHGLASVYTDYTGIAKDIASHGLLVIMLNHQDGSCAFTETKDGEEMIYKKVPTY